MESGDHIFFIQPFSSPINLSFCNTATRISFIVGNQPVILSIMPASSDNESSPIRSPDRHRPLRSRSTRRSPRKVSRGRSYSRSEASKSSVSRRNGSYERSRSRSLSPSRSRDARRYRARSFSRTPSPDIPPRSSKVGCPSSIPSYDHLSHSSPSVALDSDKYNSRSW